jgi:hypothetical protein
MRRSGGRFRRLSKVVLGDRSTCPLHQNEPSTWHPHATHLHDILRAVYAELFAQATRPTGTTGAKSTAPLIFALVGASGGLLFLGVFVAGFVFWRCRRATRRSVARPGYFIASAHSHKLDLLKGSGKVFSNHSERALSGRKQTVPTCFYRFVCKS